MPLITRLHVCLWMNALDERIDFMKGLLCTHLFVSEQTTTWWAITLRYITYLHYIAQRMALLLRLWSR